MGIPAVGFIADRYGQLSTWRAGVNAGVIAAQPLLNCFETIRQSKATPIKS